MVFLLFMGTVALLFDSYWLIQDLGSMGGVIVGVLWTIWLAFVATWVVCGDHASE